MLTPKQKHFLAKMVAAILRDNKPPTVRAMLDETGLKNVNSAYGYLKALIRKGYVVQSKAKHSCTYHIVGIKTVIDTDTDKGKELATIISEA